MIRKVRGAIYDEEVVFHWVGNELARATDAILTNELINVTWHDFKLLVWDITPGKGYKIARDSRFKIDKWRPFFSKLLLFPELTREITYILSLSTNYEIV